LDSRSITDINANHALLITDTAYRIVVKDEHFGREEDLVFSFINSLTLLFAELEGRHYGGGVLELVPSEIEKLRIPLTSITTNQIAHLDDMIRNGEPIDKILDYTDPLLLGVDSALKLTQEEILIIRKARNRVRDRRMRSNLLQSSEY
jgi:adenine-specific DNA-methyltransferase